MNAFSESHGDPSNEEHEPIQPPESTPTRLSVTDILQTLIEESGNDYHSDSTSDIYTPDSSDSPTTQVGDFSTGMNHEIQEEDTFHADRQSESNHSPTPPSSSPLFSPTLPSYLFLLGSAAAARERRGSAQVNSSRSSSPLHNSSSHNNPSYNNISDEDARSDDSETDVAGYTGAEEDIGIDEDYSDFDGTGSVRIGYDGGDGVVRHELTVVQLVRGLREMVGGVYAEVWPGERNLFENGEERWEEGIGGYMRFPVEGEGVGDGSGEGTGLLG